MKIKFHYCSAGKLWRGIGFGYCWIEWDLGFFSFDFYPALGFCELYFWRFSVSFTPKMIGRGRRFRSFGCREPNPIGWLKWIWRLIRFGGSPKRELLYKMKKASRKTVFNPPLTPDQIEIYHQAYQGENQHGPTHAEPRANQSSEDRKAAR